MEFAKIHRRSSSASSAESFDSNGEPLNQAESSSAPPPLAAFPYGGSMTNLLSAKSDYDSDSNEEVALRRSKSGGGSVISFLKSGGTKVLEKGNKVLEKGLEKRNKLSNRMFKQKKPVDLNISIPNNNVEAEEHNSPVPIPPPRSTTLSPLTSPGKNTHAWLASSGYHENDNTNALGSYYKKLAAEQDSNSAESDDSDSGAVMNSPPRVATLKDEKEPAASPLKNSADKTLELRRKGLTSSASRIKIPRGLRTSDEMPASNYATVREYRNRPKLSDPPPPTSSSLITTPTKSEAPKPIITTCPIDPNTVLVKQALQDIEQFILARPLILKSSAKILSITRNLPKSLVALLFIIGAGLSSQLLLHIALSISEKLPSEYVVPLVTSLCLGAVVYSLCLSYLLRESSKKDAEKPKEIAKPNQKQDQKKSIDNTEIIDPKKCYCTGRGIEEKAGKIDEDIEFTIQAVTMNGKKYTKSIDKECFKVEIQGAQGTKLQPSLNDNEDGTITVTYNSKKTGLFKIYVTFGGSSLPGTPFTVGIDSGDISASNCIVRGSGLGGAPVVVCERLEIKVETADQFGHPIKVGGAKDGFSLRLYEQTGQAEVTSFGGVRAIDKEREFIVETNVQDNQDGTYTITYSPLRVGLFQLEFCYEGNLIKKSSLFVIPEKKMPKIIENAKKNRAIFKAKIIEVIDNIPSSTKAVDEIWPAPQKVEILITQQQIALNSFFVLGFFSKRIETWRMTPSLKITMNMSNDREFLLEHKSRTFRLSCKERDVFYGTVKKFLNDKVGKSNVFEDKRAFFFDELRLRHSKSKVSAGATAIQVSRQSILKDAYCKMKDLSSSQWRGNFYVSFLGESGVDTGGITKEFFTILAREIFNPNNNLFGKITESSNAVHPQPFGNITPPTSPGFTAALISKSLNTLNTSLTSLHNAYSRGGLENSGENKISPNSPTTSPASTSLDIFKFAGKFLAKCIYDSAVKEPRLVNVSLTKAFYKLLLHLPVDFTDFAIDDPDFYTAKIKYILENNIDEAGLDLTFTEEDYDKDGKLKRIVELRPNGANTIVTEANKIEYLHLLGNYRLFSRVEKQVASFREGFYSLIPEDLISMFDENELELLICGLPNISIEDMKANTTYLGGLSPESPVVVWFWTALEQLTQEELARLLQFVTGSSQIPLDGFKSLHPPFTIAKSYSAPGGLPHAHTCLNQLDLPEYKNMKQLNDMLMMAITHFTEGFGIA